MVELSFARAAHARPTAGDALVPPQGCGSLLAGTLPRLHMASRERRRGLLLRLPVPTRRGVDEDGDGAHLLCHTSPLNRAILA